MDGTVCRACIPVPGLPLLYRNILYDFSGCGCKKGIAADGIFYGMSFASYCKSASVPPLLFSCFQYNRRDGRIWGQNVVHRESLVVGRSSFIVLDGKCRAFAFERKNRRPGWAPLRGAPTTLVSAVQQKIPETEVSKIPFLVPLYPTSDHNAVGAGQRPARPGLRFLYVPRNPPSGFPPSA